MPAAPSIQARPSHSVTHPPPSVHIDGAPSLDCPLLSPATLNLLGTCLQPLPTFDAPLPHLPHIFVTHCTPSTFCIPSCGPPPLINPTLSSATLNPGGSKPNTPIRSGCFSSPISNPKYTPSTPKKLIRAVVVFSRITWLLTTQTNPRKAGALKQWTGTST